MFTSSRCPTCGAERLAGSPEQLCPACLLRAGLSDEHSHDLPGEPTRTAVEGTPSSPDTDDLRALFPELDIQEEIGRGGMGVVYRARQKHLDRRVALKILPRELAGRPGFIERFQREARALARLSHPNIVALYDVGERGGLCWLVMEHVEGANLRNLMAVHAVTPAQALAIVPQICAALQYAHDEGVVHRDIKPENILVDGRLRVKIADFGLAKLMEEDRPEPTLTHTGAAMGTPRYMAPEQFVDTKTVDHRADIYSLGVVFYEMLTGELPMGRFPPPSERAPVDARVDEVVLRSLEREPQRRFQRAEDVRSAVEHIAVSPPPPPSPPPETGAAANIPPPDGLRTRMRRLRTSVLLGIPVTFLLLYLLRLAKASVGMGVVELVVFLLLTIWMIYALLGLLARAQARAPRRPADPVLDPLRFRLRIAWVCLGVGLSAGLVAFVLASNLSLYMGLVEPGDGDLPGRTRVVFWVCAPLGLVLSLTGGILAASVALALRAIPAPLGLRIRSFFAVMLLPLIVVEVAWASSVNGLVYFVGGLANWAYETKESLWAMVTVPGCLVLVVWFLREAWRRGWKTGPDAPVDPRS